MSSFVRRKGGSDHDDLDASILSEHGDNHLMDLDTSFDFEDNGSLHLSDLGDEPMPSDNSNGQTTLPDDASTAPAPIPELNLGFMDAFSDDGETTLPDDSFNLGSADTSLSTNFTDDTDMSDTSMSVGGRRKRKTRRRTRKSKRRSTKKRIHKRRKTRKVHKRRRTHTRRTYKRRPRQPKMKGGQCFGNGVGANTDDPNFSVYNTRLPTLFPYQAYQA